MAWGGMPHGGRGARARCVEAQDESSQEIIVVWETLKMAAPPSLTRKARLPHGRGGIWMVIVSHCEG